MKLLMLLMAVSGLAQVMANDTCSVLFDRTRSIAPSDIVSVHATGTSTPVMELNDNMNITVSVSVPRSTGYVQCLLILGRMSSKRHMMPSACQNATMGPGKANCTYTIKNVNATQNEDVDLRILMGPVITRYGGVLNYKYTGQQGPNTAPVVEIAKDEDPHSSKMEAFLAAKWEEQRRKMAEEEDKNSEGDWQKLEQQEKQKHEDEMQTEIREYEIRQAAEERRREEMIRLEILDKEENERIEDEFRRRSTPQPTALPDVHEDRVEEEHDNNEVDVQDNDIVVDSGSSGYAGLAPVLVLLASIVAALLV